MTSTTPAGHGPLARLADWPVPAAAAAVIGPRGLLATYGDIWRPFALASVTKPLTALAVLVAVEEGAIELDDPAGVEAVPGATVRHLFAHASGLAADRVVRAVAPGTRRIYSNVGIDLLAAAVSHASGIDFTTYFAEGVAGPLGLHQTTVGPHPSRDGVSTVADLARVAAEFLTPGAFLHPATVAEAAGVQFPGLRGVLPGFGPQADNTWGLGLEIRGRKSPHWTGQANSTSTFGHFGQSGTMLWVDPVAGLALVALADRAFDAWAKTAWPVVSDAVLAEWGPARGSG